MHIKVRVKTGAKNERVRKVADDCFEINVREKPEANAANRRVLELLAMHLNISRKRLRITKGHHSPSKHVAVGGQ